MRIQDWGAVKEMIGGLAIIVSLLYVALQTKQNTEATQFATSQAFIDLHGKVILPLSCAVAAPATDMAALVECVTSPC